MALNIKDPTADRLARELAITRIALQAAARKERDRHTSGEILGYDADGLPT
jgi:hypothetical protein